jgi:hypothetical protein
MKITRRSVLAGAGAAACVAGAAGRLPALPRPAGVAAATAGAEPILRITQRGADAVPVVAGAPLHWQLRAGDMLDPRELAARVTGRGRLRVQAELDGANHLLLVDALRSHGGAILRQRWSEGAQRWTLVARIRA